MIRAVRPLQRIKAVALVLGVGAAVIGLFGASIFLPSAFAGKPIQDALKLIAVVLGSTAAMCQFLIQRYALMVEMFSDRLSDAETCAADLAKTLKYIDLDELNSKEMTLNKPWSGQLAPSPFDQIFHVDPIDRQRLLLLKSVEHGLLEAVKSVTVVPTGGKVYKLMFKPSHFRPPAETPSTPPRPLSVRQATLWSAVTGSLTISVGAFSMYTFMHDGYWWVVYPSGIITMFLCLISFAFAHELRVSLRRKRSDPTQPTH